MWLTAFHQWWIIHGVRLPHADKCPPMTVQHENASDSAAPLWLLLELMNCGTGGTYQSRLTDLCRRAFFFSSALLLLLLLLVPLTLLLTPRRSLWLKRRARRERLPLELLLRSSRLHRKTENSGKCKEDSHKFIKWTDLRPSDDVEPEVTCWNRRAIG